MSLNDWANLGATLVLTFALLVLSWTDLREKRLPDLLTLGLVPAGLSIAAARSQGVPTSEISAAAIGFLLFWLIGEVYYRSTGREGLGLGDAKLFAAAGAWVGLHALPVVLLIATLSALAFVAIFRPSDPGQLAFGPWLSLGFWLTWVFGG